MRILFVHQSFPGQYRHVLRTLASQGSHELVALGIEPLKERIPKSVIYVRYPLERGTSTGIHPWVAEPETKVIRAEACARAAFRLLNEGFVPDLICAHPGWGEALFLADVWNGVPILSYQEFFYRAQGFDFDFDLELQGHPTWESCAFLRMKNANPLLMLDISSWNVSPTKFQRSSFPSRYHSRISVIHDGIDTSLASPDSPLGPLTLPDGVLIGSGEQIITFVNRTIEPYRGAVTFIRAIPEIQSLCPDARIVIVGAHEGVSYGKAASVGNWRDLCLAEIAGHYDKTRVHFTGSLEYLTYLHLLKLSSCHVYLTYPFVLSWSLLEAMSIGLPIVGSSTLPVKEIIVDRENGLLVDFFSPYDLACAVNEILTNRDLALLLGSAARKTILENYSLEKCVPRHINLLQLVADKVLYASP